MVGAQSDAGQAKFNPSHQQWHGPLCVRTGQEGSSPWLTQAPALSSITSKCLG